MRRFLSLDPLMDKFPEQSTYSYANNNPISFKDPTGLEPEGEKGRDRVQVVLGLSPDEWNLILFNICSEINSIAFLDDQMARSFRRNLMYEKMDQHFGYGGGGGGKGFNSSGRTGTKSENGILNDKRIKNGLDKVADAAEKNKDKKTEYGIIYYYDKEGNLKESELLEGSSTSGLGNAMHDFLKNHSSEIGNVLTIIHSHPNDKFFSNVGGDLSTFALHEGTDFNKYNTESDTWFRNMGLGGTGFSMIVYLPGKKIFYSYTITDSYQYDKNIWKSSYDKFEIQLKLNDPYNLIKYLKIPGIEFNYLRRKK